jgi:hypothetical protein
MEQTRLWMFGMKQTDLVGYVETVSWKSTAKTVACHRTGKPWPVLGHGDQLNLLGKTVVRLRIGSIGRGKLACDSLGRGETAYDISLAE